MRASRHRQHPIGRLVALTTVRAVANPLASHTLPPFADAGRNAAPPSAVSDACLLSPKACGAFQANPLAVYTALWCILNGVWELLTWLTQMSQVCLPYAHGRTGARPRPLLCRGARHAARSLAN